MLTNQEVFYDFCLNFNIKYYIPSVKKINILNLNKVRENSVYSFKLSAKVSTLHS